MKNKTDFGTNSRSSLPILLLLSILLILGLTHSSNGDLYTTYYASDYNVLNGTYVNGTLPGSIQQVDSDYFIVRSSPSATYFSPYNPSGYNLLGSTTLDSGSVSNLTTDNGSYMTFEAYASNFSSTYSNAFIAYQAETGAEDRIPKYRTWNGTVWSNQSSMSTADNPLRWFRSVYFPLEERPLEKIVVTLSDDQYLDAYVWNGSSWSNSSNIGQVGVSSVDTRCYDVKYEKTDGNALLVWSTGGGTVDMQYAIWNGTAWSSTYDLDLTGTASGTEIYWIAMAQNPTNNSNELALIAADGTNDDVYGVIWNGTAWESQQRLETSAGILEEECVAVAYEQMSGHAIFVWARSPDNTYSRQWNETAWDASSTLVDLSGPAAPNWLTLKPDPVSDRLMLVSVDGQSDLNTADWNGTEWAIHAEHDGWVNTHSERCADLDWEASGSKALLVWGTDTINLSWKTWTPSGGWTTRSDFNYAGDEAVWVQCRRDFTGIGTAKIFVSASDVGFRGYVAKWNGTALNDSVTFATNLVATTYENFDLTFQNFAEPNEYTAEVEFTGTSNTGTWTQLNWTIDSAWDTSNVSATLQLYNYSSGTYPTGGDGYINYTSSSTPDTDENKNQTVTTNPEDFRDSSGNWKVKVKGVKSTSTPFKFKADRIEFKPTYYGEYTVSTEFTFSNMTTKTPTQLNLTIVSQYDIASVNVIIQVYNYTSASYPTSGEGYLNYISSSTPNTDETKQLNITTNPEDYVSNGNATIKITGILSTTTQYQQEINQLKLIYGFANSPPVLDPIGDKSVDELSLLNFTATASDPDLPAQNLTFSLGPGAPSGANITVDGYFSWTPTEAQGPGNYTIRIVVSDGSLSDYEDIWVVVYQAPLHDVAVVSVAASSYDIVSGEVVTVTVVVRNQGSETETFNVTVFYNETVIETETVVNLAAGDQRVLEFLWNTTGLAEAGYRIRAEASLVSGETETSNNADSSGIINVSERTSWQPFDWSRNFWYILLALVGLLFVFGLERRRRKKAKPHVEKQIDEFSQQFGMTHEQIKGKKMLLEIDPTSDDYKGLLSFISEAKSNNELLFVLTNRNSTLHSALSGDPDVQFLLLTSETSSPLQINERENLLPASDLSVLLDYLGSIEKIETKKTVNVLFSNLSDIILRCGFKETYKFMRLLLEAISSPKVTALIVFNPTAHDNEISSSIRGMLQKEIPRSN